MLLLSTHELVRTKVSSLPHNHKTCQVVTHWHQCKIQDDEKTGGMALTMLLEHPCSTRHYITSLSSLGMLSCIMPPIVCLPVAAVTRRKAARLSSCSRTRRVLPTAGMTECTGMLQHPCQRSEPVAQRRQLDIAKTVFVCVQPCKPRTGK